MDDPVPPRGSLSRVSEHGEDSSVRSPDARQGDPLSAEYEEQSRRAGRRESQLSYGFKLSDGRYRPPESDEEWNAFYQE